MKELILVIPALVLVLVQPPEHGTARGSADTKVRGWLSDEGCARGRAKGGTYSGTNPDCARKCVAHGAKIVLIVPDRKEILSIRNQETAAKNIGDYVEVTGTIDEETKNLYIDSVEMLAEGSAVCAIPKRSK